MTGTPGMHDSHEDDSLSLAAQVVRSLLERHGIAKHRHASFVGDFFNLSRAAAHQRVNRSAAWTLEELKALATHFGESLSGLVGAHGADDARPAVIRIGGLQTLGKVWLDRSTPAASTDSFVALEDEAGLTVVPATAVTDSKGVRVARLEIEQAITKPARVAVIDDEQDVASALCDQLRSFGLAAESFDEVEKLADEIEREPYDGYVVDWLLRKGNATTLLATIRAQPIPSAVVLLSGKLRSGSADPADVAAVCTAFRVQLIEKPAQVPLLVSALELAGLRLDRPSTSQ
jgi:CheY-like chemotaxis protein